MQFRPQRQPQGHTGNAYMYPAGEGAAAKMEGRDDEQANHGGSCTPAKVVQQRMLHPPPE